MTRASAWSDRVFGQPDFIGALPQLYAATMPDVKNGEYFGPDGAFQSRGNPRRVTPSSAARREADGPRLWDASEQMTGVTYPWPS